MKTRNRMAGLLRAYALAMTTVAATGALAETIEMTTVETAGMCGYREMWDVPIVTAEDGFRRVGEPSILTDRGQVAPFAETSPFTRTVRRTQEGEVLPAALAFDAIHRSLLVRFPDAAETLSAKLAEGYAIERLEMALPFLDEELWPEREGYEYRANWGASEMYVASRPTWHAIAYGLLKPWKADPVTGPTYNAFVNGAGYWSHFGAQDANDRVAMQFGPTPVHYQSTAGRMDITACLCDERFGATLGERLRRLSDCGFLVRKWETHDQRYRQGAQGAYEWATGTGPRAIVIKSPSLIATISEAKPRENAEPRTQNPEGIRIASGGKIDLPPAADIAALAKGTVIGTPTAVMPSEAELAELEKRLASTKPDDMEAWQWERIQELLKWAYGESMLGEPFWYEYVPQHVRGRIERQESDVPFSRRLYEHFVDAILARPYRGWDGFDAGQTLAVWFLYKDALPLPAQESFKNYWDAWLMPDRDSAVDMWDENDLSGAMVHPQLEHPMRTPADKVPDPAEGRFDGYWTATGDWRGNKSYYRSGYTRSISTMNFNNTSSMGALLGGTIIGSEKAIADGRYGQSVFVLRLWTWGDGSFQEEGDDFYFCHTMNAQNMIAKFSSDAVGHLMGKSMLLKGMTALAETYHPGLRRYVTGSSRTSPNFRLVTQDALYYILHTLSKAGTKLDVGADPKAAPEGGPTFGESFPLGDVARASASGTFAPAWYQQVIDDKAFPFETKATYTQWGGFTDPPILKTSYLGRHYGLYTSTYGHMQVPATAHWRRTASQAQTTRDIGTLFIKSGINGETDFVSTEWQNGRYGWGSDYGWGAYVQSKNKFIATFSPCALAVSDVARNIASYQVTVALYNYELPAPTWDIYIDGEKIAALPVECRPGQTIAIKDGVTYIGIIPLEGERPREPLGNERPREPRTVILRPGDTQHFGNNATATAALVIDNVLYKNDTPFETVEALQTTTRLSTGFAVEFADADDYPDFAAFMRHLRDATVTSLVDEDAGTHDVAYASGGDTLEMTVNTTHADSGDITVANLFAKRLVNGASPDLPKGVERASPFSIQSRTGTLELGNNRLSVTEGALAVLQVAPVDGTVLAVNPLAELIDFALTTKDGVEVTANGKVGILFLTLNHGTKTLSIEHAFTPEQSQDPSAATALAVKGLAKGYATTLNGTPVEGDTISLR
ncbi:MAG: hypothetical protein FWF84_03605 [Kiritimatiellaeota bacterium]|nr:hypothetical protein [Kiritimatiellota bacterium]